MSSDFYITFLSILVLIWFGIMAVFLFVIGLRGILMKRPFLVSNRWLLLIMCISLGPSIIVIPFLPGDTSFVIKWLNPSIFTVLLVMMFFALKGYVAYAVTDTAFRDALLASLEKLQLPYEETVSALRLTSLDIDLQVAVQSWMGTGQIKVKQRGYDALLTKITTAMNEHFQNSSPATNLTACVFFVIMGVLVVGGGIGMFLLFQNII